jgi:hypothetical protein
LALSPKSILIYDLVSRFLPDVQWLSSLCPILGQKKTRQWLY